MESIDLIVNGTYTLYLELTRARYCFERDTGYQPEEFDILVFNYRYNGIDLTTRKACERLQKARKSRARNIRKHLELMLVKPCLFLTLTFTDEVLTKCNETTLRRYVTNYIKSFNTLAILNKDYGGKYERLHYHCVIQLDNIDFSSYPYGKIFFKRVKGSGLTVQKRISKYVTDYNKLVNHAMKSTVTQKTIFINFNKK